ncbi:hypothetical protein JHK87_006279 [Glycine soja]|nr:hypothetical protein JHK87_006279 [Glycine soja]
MVLDVLQIVENSGLSDEALNELIELLAGGLIDEHEYDVPVMVELEGETDPLEVDLTQYVKKHEFVFDAVLNEEVNRDLISNEMQQLRQQLKYLQAKLCSRGGAPVDEVWVCIRLALAVESRDE